jgi:hypothetical protein
MIAMAIASSVVCTARPTSRQPVVSIHQLEPETETCVET